MWNFERKWAKNNFLICRALWGNGVVWVCLQGGGDSDWVSCWLSWLRMWLNQWIVGIVDRFGWFGWWLCVFSLGLGVQWVGWLYFEGVGGGVDRIGWYWWWLGMCSLGSDPTTSHHYQNIQSSNSLHTQRWFTMTWMTVYWLTGERWLRHWMVGWVRCVWCWLGVG